MRATRDVIEAARQQIIERYVIASVDRMLSVGEMALFLNQRVRAATGHLFNELQVTELLNQFGFAEYQVWQEKQNQN